MVKKKTCVFISGEGTNFKKYYIDQKQNTISN